VLGSSVPGAEVPTSQKAPVLSNCHGSAGDRTVTSQCPSRTLSPTWGQSVGGVSERAGAKAGGSNPFARTNSFACRGGERHPDLLEGAALRGVTSERGSWSVRSRVVVSPTASRCADDRGCPKGAEEGNVVSMRHKAHAPRDAREIAHSLGDASFTRSGGPCTSILTTHQGASCGGGANGRASRLGKPG